MKRLGLVVLGMVWLAACGGHPPYVIDGVGVGSECRFTGEFADRFPCDSWMGSSATPEAATAVYWRDENASGIYVGLVSSEKILRIEGDVIVSVEVDGSLAMMLINITNRESVVVIHSIDGATSECLIAPNDGILLKCENW